MELSDTTSAFSDNRVKVFLDCNSCSYQHISENTRYVRYVRDMTLADVHLLITTQGTAAGGRSYDLQFIGKGDFSEINTTLEYVSPQSDTWSIRRDGLLRTIALGLLPYVSQTSAASNVSIMYDEEDSKVVEVLEEDPWDNWVFDIWLRGGVEMEESQDEYRLTNSVTANRITEEWKLRNGFWMRYEEEHFTEENITSFVRRWSLWSAVIKSLGEHWSAGFFADFGSSTYHNKDLEASINPAIEYNFFPWKESTDKEFTIAYSAGMKHLNYADRTIYNKMEETLPYHELRIYYDMIQVWGNADGRIVLHHFPFEKNKYSIRAEADISFRLSQGLSVFIGVEAESIHDQLSLAAGGASLDEILLKRTQLATSYAFEMNFGISYSFGSIYNNVVNPRL